MKPEAIEYTLFYARHQCEVPGCGKPYDPMTHDIHHIYFRSQYKGEDRNDPWNLAILCHEHHMLLHDGKLLSVDQWLKAKADSKKARHLRTGGTDKALVKQRKQRKRSYDNFMARYRAEHNGLSPSQVQYRKDKERKEFLKTKYGSKVSRSL